MRELDLIITGTGTVHTCSGSVPKRGSDMLDTSPIQGVNIGIIGEKIVFLGYNSELKGSGFCIGDSTKSIDAVGGDIIPGFVDSHTHLIWLGDRRDEFAQMLRGTTYEEITASGGGINTTVSKTRDASLDELVEVGIDRAKRMLAYGTTTIESKSGYSLTFDGELRMLQASDIVRSSMPQNIVITFLGAHLVPKEYKDNREDYVQMVVEEMIPAVAEQGLADFIDVFMEFNAFDALETERILKAGIRHGLRARLHADELSDTGASYLAVEKHASSCDHLECISDTSIKALANSNTVATLMPGVSLYLNLPKHAPFKKLYDAGCIIALATDFNPGTSPSISMQGAFAQAVLSMRMPVEVALTASTINAAFSLGLQEKVGSIEVGKKADIVILKGTPVDIAYHWGENHAQTVICSGKIVSQGGSLVI